MKQLIYTNGGQPIDLDDFRYVEENVKDLTSALGNMISSSAYILHGATISVSGSGGPTPLLSITSGTMWYLDEIYLIDAVVNQALPASTTESTVQNTYEWDLSVVNSDTRTFEDASSHEVLTTRKAVLVSSASTWVGLSNLPLMIDLIKTQTRTALVITEESTALGISGYYSVTNYTGNTISDENLRTTSFYNKVTMAGGMPASIAAFRVSLNSTFDFINGGVYKVMGKINTTVTELYLVVTSVTNTTFDVYQSDGTLFAAADVVEYWYSGVNIT